MSARLNWLRLIAAVLGLGFSAWAWMVLLHLALRFVSQGIG